MGLVTSKKITNYMNSSLYYQKIYLNLDTAGYYYLETLCSESMWVFNTLLEGKVASHSRHLKIPHDLLWTMSPRFEGNPFTQWKHLWMNCPHLTVSTHQQPLETQPQLAGFLILVGDSPGVFQGGQEVRQTDRQTHRQRNRQTDKKLSEILLSLAFLGKTMLLPNKG